MVSGNSGNIVFDTGTRVVLMVLENKVDYKSLSQAMSSIMEKSGRSRAKFHD